MFDFITKIFDSNERNLKELYPIVEEINALEDEVKELTHEEIKEQTQNWKNELSVMSEKEADRYLEEILPRAYAIVRESSRRILEMRHYDVQLLAGIALHQGKIAEQRTGEGKTLTATLPVYLNSLTGRGVHLVTPNDYLSRHGAGWMGALYNYLGIQVGVVLDDRSFVYDADYESADFQDDYSKHLREVPRIDAYKADVTYGTNHTFGFDYLRDNMARSLQDIVQTNPKGEFGSHYFAILDEVDFLLIDVARTPLIISQASAQPTERYAQADQIVKGLIQGTDYEVDEKFNNVTLTDLGIRRVEKRLGMANLYEQDFEMVHLIEQSLTAHYLREKDKDYVVKDGQIIIVDQFTGRLLPSNRFSQGLHQAIEVKEGVPVQQESRTLAEISYQNYFRMYEKLAGMTGTAMTEAEEFHKIYDLDVIVIPTNKPVARKDHNDVVYKTEAGKFKAVADDIVKRHKNGQPVLVGTTSVEKSEMLHELLRRRNVQHEILNAKNHEREALIIAQAGRKGAVTISTNMAGRGVDIILGGDPSTPEEQQEVKDLGGLHVIGTERHESRRIDNQLRGRAGRQGDPGSSRFYISLQDYLMRVFGGSQVERMMDRLGIDDNMPLEAGLVSKSIENAQKKVEGIYFDRRKNVVEMDDVINVHREVIYKLRKRLLEMVDGNAEYKNWVLDKLTPYVVTGDEEEDLDAYLGPEEDQPTEVTTETDKPDFLEVWNENESKVGEEQWSKIVGYLSLPVIDMLWMEHLVDMAHVRDGIGLRGYAQRDPVVEYKKEAHIRFENLLDEIYTSIIDRISRTGVDVSSTSSRPVISGDDVKYAHGEFESGVTADVQQGSGMQTNSQDSTPRVRTSDGREIKVEEVKSGVTKVGRNDPCPCGSGKKYKKCHGKNA